MEITFWIKEYEKVGKRKKVIWQEFLKAKKTLACWNIAEKYKKIIQEAEFLVAMFIVLLDDVVDEQKNRQLFNDLTEIPFKKNASKNPYFLLTQKIWKRLIILLKKAPNYQKFEALFLFDIRQVLNALYYDLTISDNPALINLTEVWLYAPQSMQFLFNQSIYLMFSKKTDKLNLLRQINWLSLKMVRIGNWLYTWERELKSRDFTSGVFALGIDKGIFKLVDLKITNRKTITSLIQKSNIEQELLQEWEKCYNELKSFTGKTMVDVAKLLCGLKKTLSLEASLAKKIK